MIDELLELVNVGKEARAESYGDLVPRIWKWVGEQVESDNEYRGSRLWALCSFKAVLDVLFPQFAKDVKPLKLTIRNGIGTYTHRYFQNEVLAKSGILWGDWKCVRCGKEWKDQLWTEGPQNEKLDSSCPHIIEYQEKEVVWKAASPFGKDIFGHIDGIFFPAGVRHLLDIKTVTAKTFNYYLKEPSEDHIYQLNVYMALDPDEAEWSVILYVNLETGEMKSFRIRKNPEVMKDAKRKISALRDWYSTFTGDKQAFAKALLDVRPKGQKSNVFANLPPRACVDPTSKRARFCPQRDQCWNVPAIEGAIKKAAKGG